MRHPPTDLLHINQSSKVADKDYQWFRSKDAPNPHLWRSPNLLVWTAVLRSTMPNESSDNEDFIQRGYVQLFECQKSHAEEERARDLKRALDCVEVVKSAATLKIFLPEEISSRIPATHIEFTRHKLKSGITKHPRGRVYILHEITIERSRFRKLLMWNVRVLALCRIVFLSHDEAEMANLQGTTYAEWAWHKMDYLRGR